MVKQISLSLIWLFMWEVQELNNHCDNFFFFVIHLGCMIFILDVPQYRAFDSKPTLFIVAQISRSEGW